MTKPKRKMLKQIEHVIDVMENDRHRPGDGPVPFGAGGRGGFLLVTDEEAEALARLSRCLKRHIGLFPGLARAGKPA